MESERGLTSEKWAAGPGQSATGGQASDQGSDERIAEANDLVRNSVATGVGTLESDVGSEMYQQLLADFLGHLRLQVAELGNAAAVGDIPAARYVAHQIKGTAPSFGAVYLDELADRLLRIGRDQGDLLPSLVDEIGQEVGQLQAVLGG